MHLRRERQLEQHCLTQPHLTRSSQFIECQPAKTAVYNRNALRWRGIVPLMSPLENRPPSADKISLRQSQHKPRLFSRLLLCLVLMVWQLPAEIAICGSIQKKKPHNHLEQRCREMTAGDSRWPRNARILQMLLLPGLRADRPPKRDETAVREHDDVVSDHAAVDRHYSTSHVLVLPAIAALLIQRSLQRT